MKESETLKGAPFWIAAILTAMVSVAYAQLFRFAEHQFLHLSISNPHLVFIITPVGFFLSWFIVHRVAPNASGSGIPQVLASIELSQGSGVGKSTIRHLVSFPITIVKILSSFIIVLCGGAVGREGPTIQISAYIFHSVGCRFEKIWKTASKDVFFISGGAAGIAAAFNTPLGGVVYAIEELSKTSFHRYRTSLFSAVIIAGVIAQILSGPYLFIGIPALKAYSGKILVYSMLIGAVAGLGGAFFGKLLFIVSRFRKSIKNPYMMGILTIVLGLVVASLIFWVSPRASTSGKDLVIDYLFNKESSTWQLVLVRFISPILTFFSGAAGGVFSPALSAGASIGAFIADFTSTDYRNTCIILGMVSFLSGFTAAPFTSFVLVLEMTDRHSIILPMMIASLGGFLISQLVNKVPFYEMLKVDFVEAESVKKKPPQ